jgi:signal transduction histidine kinase
MKWFRNLPIRRKLIFAMVIVSVVAVLFGGSLRIFCDFLKFRQAAINDLSMLAQIVGENCAAALEFDNPQAAQETLASLKARPDIVAASVHRNDGTLLAVYPTETATENLLEENGSREWMKEGQLLLQRPVVRGGEALGVVQLHSDLRQHYQHLLSVVGTMLATMLVSIGIALLLALRLQRVLSVPILNLASVAERVAEHEDYSLRANCDGGDEIGTLTERFNRMLAAIQERDSRLRQLSMQVLHSQDGERRRIARELHDVTGQNLVALGLTLKNLQHAAASLSEQDRELLIQAMNLTQQSTQELRTLSYLLYPPLLDDHGLAAAVNSYIQGFSQRTKIRVAVEISPDLDRCPRETELALFRVLQESLTNIHRHACSSEAWIRVRKESEKIFMEIQDKGKGFAMRAATAAPRAQTGVGIMSMRERLRELGGELTLESSPSGTTVRAVLPIMPDKTNEPPAEPGDEPVF